MADPTADPKTEFAFPSGLAVGTDGGLFVSAEVAGCGGLTKREYFAAMALSGLARAYAQGGDFMESHIAEGAVKIADAVMKELGK